MRAILPVHPRTHGRVRRSVVIASAVALGSAVGAPSTVEATAAPVALAASASGASDPVITTVVGAPPNGPAEDIQYVGPLSLSVAPDGSLLVVDRAGARVRRIVGGQATVLAGIGEAVDFGDGSLATSASLAAPAAAAQDANGVVYIADAGAHRVRSIGLDGVLRTFAGSTSRGAGADGVAAVGSALDTPSGLAVDAAGNVYIADTGNNRVRQVTPQGIITTVAGTGVSGFNGDGAALTTRLSAPDKLLATSAGVYVADRGNARVRLLHDGSITTVAGGGANAPADGVNASAALLSGFSFAVGAGGTLYLTDGSVFRVDGANVLRAVSIGAITGVPTPQEYAFRDIVITAGGTIDLAEFVRIDVIGYAGDKPSRIVVSVPPAGQPTLLSGIPREDPPNPDALHLHLINPTHLAVTADSTIYVRHAPPVYGPVANLPFIERITGSVTQTAAARARGPLGTGLTGALAVLSNVSSGQSMVLRLEAGGSTTLFQGPGTGPSCIDGVAYPDAIVESSTLGIVLYDSLPGRNCLKRWTGGAFSPGFSVLLDMSRFGGLDGLAAAPDGSLVFSDATTNQIWRVNAAGQVSLVAGTGVAGFSGDGGPAVNAQLDLCPTPGSPSCAVVGGLAVGSDGTIYVADTFSARVRMITPSGTIQTIAGNGTYGYSGDGGPANLATFNKPVAVAVDAQQNVYVLDSAAGTVRRITPVPPVPAGASRFVPVAPQRVLDTREGIGAPTGLRAAGSSLNLQVSGSGTAVPADATAVVLNVTITEAANRGFVQVFPTGRATIGSSSNLNVDTVGQTIPNLVASQIGDGGHVTLYTSGGGHLVADLLGYFVPVDAASRSGRYVALAPARILDTRTGLGQAAQHKPGAQEQVVLNVSNVGGVPTYGASAVVLNVTATETDGPGFVQVIPTNGPTPAGASSNLNVTRVGQTIPNLVIVPVGDDGTVTLYTHSGAHLVADVSGYFTDDGNPASVAGLFVPVAPGRLVDTRDGGTKPGPSDGIIVRPAGLFGIPVANVSAIFTNLTATEASAPGWVQAGPAGITQYGASSNLNIERAGQTIPNATIMTLSDDLAAVVYTQNGTHLIVDAAGWFAG